MKLLQKKIEQLGFTLNNGLHIYEERSSWSDLSPRTRHIIDIIKPYAFYCIDQKPFILFFDYSLKDEYDRKELDIKIWNSQTPVIIIEKDNYVEIKNGFLLDKKKKELSVLTKKENIDMFSFWNIASGKTWESLEKEFKKKKLDDYLLENIRAIVDNIHKTDSKPFANSLVLRLIFIRYLIDREIEIDFEGLGGIDRETAKKNLVNIVQSKEQLYALFNYLKHDAFNGDLFELYSCPNTKRNEKDIISQEVLNELSFFLSGSDIKNKQFVLFDLYDFNIIPVELISNIYERFLGTEKQKRDGAFYTPPFLVDYILKNTVTPYLANNKECCILDPACGSGIFLVEALRFIIENNLEDRTYFDDEENEELKSYLVKNIFGIDKNREAIEVAVFSLYITLLDYKNPKKLKSFTFPSLIEDNFIVENFFNTKEIEKKLSEKDFRFIIGNPPWGSYSDEGDFHTEYVDTVNKQYKELKATAENLLSDYQIAQSYLHRLKKFVSEDTRCALILTSKILYNANAKNFRQNFLLSECKISKVLELSPVRHQIYSKAVGPSAILFFQYGNNSLLKQEIKYISLKPNIFFRNFKIIVQEAFDTKTIPTKLFIENDWAWKVFLYGNILDFYFLKRLKNDNISFPTINEIINKYNLQFGVGVQIGGGDDNDSRHLKGISFLDTKDTDDFERYHVKKPKGVFNYDTIHRPRPKKEDIFKAPFLLIKKGVSSVDFKSCAAYYGEDLIFTDAVTSIKGSDNDINLLRNLVGAVNSDLFTYYLLMTASSIGIEREQAHNEEERFTFPVTIDKRISKNIEDIEFLLQNKEQIHNKLHELLTNNLLLDNEVNLQKLSFEDDLHKIENTIVNKEQEIWDTSVEAYDIDEIENDIIDYALHISIPILKNSSEPLQQLNEVRDITPYVNVFKDYFDEIFDDQEKYFQINIYTNINNTDFMVAEFNIIDEAPVEQISFISAGKYSYDLITKFSISKHTRFFYEQKDIIGFEPTSFYIIKPNEYKNWHPAVAHIDLGKVVERIFKSVKTNNNEL